MELCPFCGEPASLDIAELHLETRELTLDACCEENLAGWIESIPMFDRRERAQWMLEKAGLAVKDILASDDTLHWTLDYGLELRPVSFSAAKEFIQNHHRHCAPPVGWKYGASLFNGDELIGVVTAGRPVSRMLAAKGYIEISRVCVKDVRPRALSQNACSILYGFACREAFRRGHPRVVTYTRLEESGVSLRAAGFTPVSVSRGGGWGRRRRPRKSTRNDGPKIRWERWKKGQPPLQHRFRFDASLDLQDLGAA